MVRNAIETLLILAAWFGSLPLLCWLVSERLLPYLEKLADPPERTPEAEIAALPFLDPRARVN